MYPKNYENKYTTIQCIKLYCPRFGLSTFCMSTFLVGRCFDMSTFWLGLVCRRFGLSTFWSVDVSVCRRFGLLMFWYVDVLVCRRFSLSTFRFLDVLTSYTYKRVHFDTPNPFYPSALRAGGVLSSRVGGRAGGCQTCGTHISVTAWWIFSIRSSVELSRPVVVHRHDHLPICPKWACPWPKNLSNLVQIGSRLCGTHISETAGWIDPI